MHGRASVIFTIEGKGKAAAAIRAMIVYGRFSVIAPADNHQAALGLDGQDARHYSSNLPVTTQAIPPSKSAPGLRVLRAVAGLGEVTIGAVLHGVGVAMAELVFHGIVGALGAIVWFLGTFSAIGIVLQMVADTFRHGSPLEVNRSVITG